MSIQSQRRAHYRAADDQPVLVQLLAETAGPALAPVGDAEADRSEVDALDRSAPSFVARLNDLSESGLRLRLGAEQAPCLPLGAEVELVVSLPETNEQVRARVVHRDEPGARGSVVVGLAFVDQDRASADRIRRHVFAVQREMLARRCAEPGD